MERALEGKRAKHAHPDADIAPNPVEIHPGPPPGNLPVLHDEQGSIHPHAIESVPLLSMRKFAARVQRFIDAYATGSSGSEVIKWATKQFKGHRQTPVRIAIQNIRSQNVDNRQR